MSYKNSPSTFLQETSKKITIGNYFAQFLRILRRRFKLIFIIAAIGVILSAIYATKITATYTAKALIEIPFEGDADKALLSEMAIVQSRDVVQKATEDLALQNNSSLRVEAQKKSIDDFLKYLDVRPLKGTYILQIRYTSKDPKDAELSANAVAQAYLNQKSKQQSHSSHRLAGWLEKRMENLQSQLDLSEKNLLEFKMNQNISQRHVAQNENAVGNSLQPQIIAAKTKEAEALSKMSRIKDWQNNPEKINATTEAKNSAIFQKLKSKKTDALSRVSKLSVRYGEKHPKMIAARAELKDVQSQLRQEQEAIARLIEEELYIAQSAVLALKNSLNGSNNFKFDVNDSAGSHDLDILKRAVEDNKARLDQFLKMYQQATSNSQAYKALPQIVSYASAPSVQSYPNKLIFISTAFILSTLLGVLFALLREKMNSNYKTAKQLERETGYCCYGHVPYVVASNGARHISDYVLNNPASNVAESIRALRLSLKLQCQNQEAAPRVVTTTSSLPDEGKTTLSAWMACLAAQSGEKVIVIDCDLRRPRLQDVFSVNKYQTLVEYLSGKATQEDIIHKDSASGAHVIFARSVPSNALDLIGQNKMTKLLESLRKKYDLIILDSPASLAVPDAKLLANLSDHTLYAVGWNETPREIVNSGVKQFADFNYDALSYVLTKIDVKRHAQYGYKDNVSYYQRYKRYYSD